MADQYEILRYLRRSKLTFQFTMAAGGTIDVAFPYDKSVTVTGTILGRRRRITWRGLNSRQRPGLTFAKIAACWFLEHFRRSADAHT
jgi:hypothetical protein